MMTRIQCQTSTAGVTEIEIRTLSVCGPVVRRQARAGDMRRTGRSSSHSPVHDFAILARSVDQLAEVIADSPQAGTNA